jgi:ubiquitin carboxyl-terminal hydrolase 7
MIQEPMLSEEYEFPINKTSRVITLPSLLYVSLDDKRNAINYCGHAKDGMEFKINVGFDVKEENVALVIQCTPSAM